MSPRKPRGGAVGRPKKDPSEKKVTMTLLVTPDTRNRIQELAHEFGLSQGAIVDGCVESIYLAWDDEQDALFAERIQRMFARRDAGMSPDL